MKTVLVGISLLMLGSQVSAQQIGPDKSRDTAKKSVAKEEVPSADEFVDVTEEPMPIVPIEKLIQYPVSAKEKGLEGRVTLQALIAKDGHVEKVQILRIDDEVFRKPAIDAMMKATFTTARQKGTPLRI